MPEELKGATTSKGESSLRGHLTTESGEEEGGSSAYVPPDKKDDKQLNYALDLLRGIEVNSLFPPDPSAAVPN